MGVVSVDIHLQARDVPIMHVVVFTHFWLMYFNF